jgi:hypothetical protein
MKKRFAAATHSFSTATLAQEESRQKWQLKL